MDEPKCFVLTEDHIKLLRNLYFNDYGGMPQLDLKRPYGDGDWIRSIAEILEWQLFEDAAAEKHLSKAQQTRAIELHCEMATVLQLFVTHAILEPGAFERGDGFDYFWHKSRRVTP